MSVLEQGPTSSQILIQITDTHLMAHPQATFLNMIPELSFHAVIEDIQQRYPDLAALIHTGDLAQEAQKITYRRYLDYMQNTKINFFQTPGNHDELAHFPFNHPEAMPTVIDLAPWSIILLNSVVQGQVDGRLDIVQLKCLEQLLQQRQDQYVILACHHHPLDMKSQWIDQHKLKNTPELMQILAPFSNIKAVLCGHVHQDSINTWNNIQFLSTPSTSVQFKPLQKAFTLDQETPGYRCLHLNYDGTFTTEIHRIHHLQPVIDEGFLGY